MKYLLALAAMLSAAALVTLGTAAGFPPRVHYVDHDKVAAALVKGGRIIEDEGLIVIANRGVQRGSEMHDNTNHVFIIVDGEAEFITGGKMVDPKARSPGQTRGSGIEGGVSPSSVQGRRDHDPRKDPAPVEGHLENRLGRLLRSELRQPLTSPVNIQCLPARPATTTEDPRSHDHGTRLRLARGRATCRPPCSG